MAACGLGKFNLDVVLPIYGLWIRDVNPKA